MAITDNKIQSSEVTRLHVQGADDILSGSPADNKAVFDALPELIVQRFNGALDTISDVIDDIVMQGTKLLTDTTAGWNAQADLVGEAGVVYVYTDYMTMQGIPIPAFKVGDGTTLLINLPTNAELDAAHRANTNIHVTSDDKEFWDNKITMYINEDTEELVFSKE